MKYLKVTNISAIPDHNNLNLLISIRGKEFKIRIHFNLVLQCKDYLQACDL